MVVELAPSATLDAGVGDVVAVVLHADMVDHAIQVVQDVA